MGPGTRRRYGQETGEEGRKRGEVGTREKERKTESRGESMRRLVSGICGEKRSRAELEGGRG